MGERLDRLRARYRWLDHLFRAGVRYTERHGDHYAAAITFFSVLSLVPLLMIGFAVAGYVLFFNPVLLEQLRVALIENVPASIAPTITDIVDRSVQQRGTVGLVGLVGALYSGIRWMSNLREALTEQWAQVPDLPTLPRRLLGDLLALLGLGLALVASFAVTGLATGFTTAVLDYLGMRETLPAQILLGVLGVVIGICANWLIFIWLIARLPRGRASFRSSALAALFGALGFEVLKLGMRYYLGTVIDSPSGAIFGPFLGLMVFAYFTSRFILFITAWAATTSDNEKKPPPPPPPKPVVLRHEVVTREAVPAPKMVGLVSVGLAAGLVGGRLLRRRR